MATVTGFTGTFVIWYNMEASLASNPISSDLPAIARRRTSLRANIYWTLAGNVVFSACQWGVLICIARLGSAALVGQYALALAVTTPLVILTNMALGAVQVTDARREFQFGTYLALRLASSAFAMLLITVVALSGSFSFQAALLILLTGLARAMDSISDVNLGYLQQQESFDLSATIRGSSGLLSLVAVALFLFITGSLVGSALALVIVSLLRLLLVEVPLIRSRHRDSFTFYPLWDFNTLYKLAMLSAPLGIVTMMSSLNSNVPRYFLEHYAGDAQLGIFAAMAYLAAIGSQFVDAIGKSTSPRLSRQFAQGYRDDYFLLLAKLCCMSFVLGVIGVAVSLVWGRELLTIVYTSEFAAQHRLLPLIMLSAGITYVSTFLGYGLTASRAFRIQPVIGSLTLLSQVASCYLLIPAMGLTGAALSLAVGAVVNLIATLSCLVVMSRSQGSFGGSTTR